MPSVQGGGPFAFAKRRREAAESARVLLQLRHAVPESDAEPGKVGGAESRSLDAVGALHRHADYVALELHEEVVRRSAAVHPQRVEGDSGVALHRVQHIRRLVGERLERRAHDVLSVHAARQSENRAARILVPVRRSVRRRNILRRNESDL